MHEDAAQNVQGTIMRPFLIDYHHKAPFASTLRPRKINAEVWKSKHSSCFVDSVKWAKL